MDRFSTQTKTVFCLSSFFFYFLKKKNSFSLQKEEDFDKKIINKNEKIGQFFNSKKGNFWTDFQLYSTYIYMQGVLLE